MVITAWLVTVRFLRLNWLVVVLEVLLLDLELSLLVSKKLQDIDVSLNDAKAFPSILLSIVGWLDFQTAITKLASVTFVWILLGLSVVIMSCTALYVRNYRSETKPPGVIVRSFIQLYGYLFYPLMVYTVTFNLCVSVSSKYALKASNPDLPVLDTSADTLSDSSVVTYNLMWTFDDNKKCLSGEYFITVVMSIVMLVAIFYIKTIQYRVVSFYPAANIPDGSRSRLTLFHPVMFLVLHALRHLIVMQRWGDILTIYLILFGVFQSVMVVLNMLYPLVYCRLTNRLQTARSLLGLYMFFWIMMYRSRGSRFSTYLQETLSLLTYGLGLGLISRLATLIRRRVSNFNIDKAIYNYESVKTNDDLEKLFKLVLAVKKHVLKCAIPYCFCKNSNWEELDSPWVTNALKDLVLKFLTFSMAEDLKVLNSGENSLVDKYQEQIRRYIWFCLTNETKIIHSMQLLSRLKKNSLNKSFFLDAVDIQLRRQAAYNSSLYSLQILPEEGDSLDNEVSAAYSIVEQLNAGMALADLVMETAQAKLKVYEGLHVAGIKDLSSRSSEFLYKYREVDQRFARLMARYSRHENRVHYLKLFYLRDVKEDWISVRGLIEDIRITLRKAGPLQGSNIDELSLKSIVATASVNTHSLSYVSMTVKALGHSPFSLIGLDMGVLMPKPLPSLHRALYSSMASKTGVIGSRGTAIVPAQRSGGGIEFVEFKAKLNWNLRRGVEFMGIMTPQFSYPTEHLLMMDDAGRLIEASTNAVEAYELGNLISDYYPEIMDSIYLVNQQKITLPISDLKLARSNVTCWLSRFSLLKVTFYLAKIHFKDEMEVSEKIRRIRSIKRRATVVDEYSKTMTSNFANKVNHQLVHQGDQSTPVHIQTEEDGLIENRHDDQYFDDASRSIADSHSSNQLEKEIQSDQFKMRKIRETSQMEIDQLNQSVGGSSVSGIRNRKTEELLYSRYLHHQMRIRIFNKLTLFLVLPLIGYMASLVFFYFSESFALSKSANATFDLLTLDAGEYVAWVTSLHVEYLDVKRMVVDGIASQTTFDKFGFNGTDRHLLVLMNSSDYFFQGPRNAYRLNRMARKSYYQEFYNYEELEGTELDILTYQSYPPTWEMVKMTPHSAIRYTQQYLDMMLESSAYQESHVLGPDLDRRNSPYEEIVRYNSLNPIHRFYHMSRLCLT